MGLRIGQSIFGPQAQEQAAYESQQAAEISHPITVNEAPTPVKKAPARKMVPAIDLGAALEDEGYKMTGFDMSSNSVIALDSDQKEQKIPYNKLKEIGATKTGLDPAKSLFELNTPDNPVQTSPVDTMDRAALQFGNMTGSLKYLQKKFDDVVYNPDNGFTVKRDGVWYAVDPKYWGDGSPWEKTRELINDVKVDTANEVVQGAATIGGALLGGAAGMAAGVSAGAGFLALGPIGIPVVGAMGLAGAITGELAGVGAGQVASSVLQKSLGRLWGTYEATPHEVAEDIAIETLTSMGAHGIGLGVELGIHGFGKAMNFIAEKTPASVKNVLADVYGSITGVGEKSMGYLLNKSKEIVGNVHKAIYGRGGRSLGEAQEWARDQALRWMDRYARMVTNALPKRYGEALQVMMSQGRAKGMKIHMGQIVKSSLQQLEDDGFGKIIWKVDNNASQELVKIPGTNFTQVVKTGTRGYSGFRALTQEEINARTAMRLPTHDALPEAFARVQKLANLLGKHADQEFLRGGDAVETLVDLNKELNYAVKGLYKTGDKQLGRAATIATDSYKTMMLGEFDKAGIAAEYQRATDYYEQFGDIVGDLNKALEKNGPQSLRPGVEPYLNRFMSTLGRGGTLPETFRKMNEMLLPGVGDKVLDQAVQHEVARQFVRWVPKFSFLQTGSGLGLATGALTKTISLAKGAAIATQFSPRAMMYQVHGINWLNSLRSDALEKFLSNEAAVTQFIRTTEFGQQKENELKNQLLKESGVVEQ